MTESHDTGQIALLPIFKLTWSADGFIPPYALNNLSHRRMGKGALSHAHHSLHIVKDGHEKDLCPSYPSLFLVVMMRNKSVRLKGKGFNLTNGK